MLLSHNLKSYGKPSFANNYYFYSRNGEDNVKLTGNKIKCPTKRLIIKEN